ncbi:YqcC family protein [Buttiauxella gaviniae]|uniref:YqcC family protein n=1 Tax=Buttiauxella gaviniae TaxID=82990 RepID=A0ABV3NRC9_9ENTR
MERHALVRQHLHIIEHVLRDHQLWQSAAPTADAFESTQPFCMDTLQPHEWLQWVLIPRMHALLDAQLPLPADFAIAPYYEMALDAAQIEREPLLKALQDLDALFARDAN